MRAVRGEDICNEYGALNDPLTIMGIERSLFALSMTFALVLFIAMESLLLGFIGFGLFWIASRVTTAYDARLIAVLRETLKNPGGWYDAGDYGAPAWVVVIEEGDGS